MTQGLFDFQGPFDFRALATPACGLSGPHRTLARAFGAGYYTAMGPQDRTVMEANHDCHDKWYFDAVGLHPRTDVWDNRRPARTRR